MAMVLDGTGGITTNSGTLLSTSDATINGQTVGKGGGNVATNTAHGVSALNGNSSGTGVTAIGSSALPVSTASNNTAVGRVSGNSTTSGSDNTFMGMQSGYSNVTGSSNVYVGVSAGYSATGSSNSLIGQGSGELISSGAKNSVLGRYNGNQGGLDIRTSSNYIVLSDGDGNPKGYFGAGSGGEFTLNASASTAYNGILNFAEAGTLKTQQYYQKSVTSFYIVNSSAGVYLGAGSTAWASASDERLKDIIEPIENGLTKVASLRAVIGKFKTDAEGTRRSFLIAQDVQAVLPEAISTTMVKDDETNTEYLGVSYTDVIPLLVASIKELKTIVDAQAAEIAELKAKVM